MTKRQASSYDFFFISLSTKLLQKRFNGFANAHMFYLNQSEK